MNRRTLVLPLFLVVPLLAGCLDGTDDIAFPVDGEADPLVVLAFTPESYLPESRQFAEPSLKVAPDGTIYVTAPGGERLVPRGALPVGVPAGRSDTVWRSDDGGATFKKLPTPDRYFGGGDSDLAIAPDGTVYQTGLWGECVSLSMSRDKGETWKTWPLGCGSAFSSNDRNWIAAYGNDVVYLTFGWAPVPVEGMGRVTLVKAELKKDPPVTTTITFEDNYQWPGNIAVDAKSGAVYIAYTTTDDEVVVLKSADQGATLSKISVAQREGDTFDSFGVVEVGEDGAVYVTWSERDKPDGARADHTDIFYAYSTDGGAHWSDALRVNSFLGNHIFPWFDAGEAGHLIVAWYGTPTTGNDPEKVKGATWHVYAAESHDANAPNGTFVEAKASSKPIIEGPICTSGTGCAAGTRDLLDFFQVALDAKGAAHLIWATKAQGDATTLAYAKQLIESPASAST